MTSPFSVEYFGISDIGLVRKNNEDVWSSLPGHHFFALADGMGGHRAGDIAASQTLACLESSIKKILSQSDAKILEASHLKQHLNYAIQDANHHIQHLAASSSEYLGMGTTLCCFLLHKTSLVYAHVGDSRIYHFRNKLMQLSEDHSLVNQLLKKGKLSQNQVERYPYKKRITKAIGTHSSILPDIDHITIQDGDLFFLCSDGLTDHLSNGEMSTMIQSETCIEILCKKLVEAAKAKGGKDNITIVMIKVTH